MTFALKIAMALATVGAVTAQSPGGTSGAASSGGPGGSSAPQMTLKIPNETAPPGGVAQMKFLITEPTPISTGRPHGLFDPTVFDEVLGIELFNAVGEENGVALINGSAISVAYISPAGVQGTDYPLMTIALHVRPDAKPGSQTQFTLDSNSSFLLQGVEAILKPVTPATITVGGSLSITNVVPGGGPMPAGTVVHVQGLGFESQTQVQTDIRASSIVVAGPTDIQITLAEAADITGRKVQVTNPDHSQDTYFCYRRGIPMGASNRAMLASALPIFSWMSHSRAIFALSSYQRGSQFTGLALQNPGLSSANVTVSLFSQHNVLLGSSTVSLPPGYRMMREISELTQGSLPQSGSYVVVSSSQPVQVFGFSADEGANTIMPFAALFVWP
jgi:hypothetical protein